MAAKKTPRDLSALSYEQARDQLIDVVTQLEAGGATLEESLTLWERGEALATRCQEWLDGARERLAQARSGDAVAAATGSTAATGSAAATGSTPATGSTAASGDGAEDGAGDGNEGDA